MVNKVLVANRGEIAIRVFRSVHELGLDAVAIYSHEDRYALHRFQADEAYQVGRPGEPIKSYLDIEAIIELALEHSVDAIHPGYGFLSENPVFAGRCRAAGLVFVGPRTDTLAELGDKTSARRLAQAAGVPVLGGTRSRLQSYADAKKAAARLKYPVMLKAAHGGGGRGMRVVAKQGELKGHFESARREALAAFGSDEVFLEKYIARARHIEVQILGDGHGGLVHLYERDCSVQRRYQKVVEIAPAPALKEEQRQAICDAAVRIARHAKYENAGTVEFLLDVDAGDFYFIEVNPRIQVEHTVTEEVTGIDLVRAQLLVAMGEPLDGEAIGIDGQEQVECRGFALQCRVTTEDPNNDFMPDYGRINQYRSASGMGIRLDAGSAFTGAVVTPFYDSLLVKVTARAPRFEQAIDRMVRALTEFRVRGVKTNIAFLARLLQHPQFRQGQCITRFVDDTSELFDFKTDTTTRTSRILRYIAETIVNGNPLVANRPKSKRRDPIVLPFAGDSRPPRGTRDVYLELGPEQFARWVMRQKRLLVTDTTFRDAHQSLFATRMRSQDMLNIGQSYAHLCPDMFSLEMWGGATFDTALRFLKECPWQRLADLREQIPNILFQMLLRASSVVGYANFPDNVVRTFIRETAEAGLDVFRIFDALNWTPNMRVAMESVHKYGGICEATICYTGDILDPERSKYSLDYYLDMARELENMGAHILCIKDMAGLLKPRAATVLMKALKETVDLPIHFHTHDTGGIQGAAVLNAVQAGVDIADAAMAPMSGGTSQPNMNTLVEALRLDRRSTKLDPARLDRLADYWRSVRDFYTPFESETLPAAADLYQHEMPGGQYTNLFEQARSLGLADRWFDICRCYAQVNQLFGDIVKVTPTSKAVGDMALFMVANDLDTDDVLDPQRELAFPASVVDLMRGMMGKSHGGFPANIRKRVLRGDKPMRGRPGSSLPAADFAAARETLAEITGEPAADREAVSWILYPKVYEEFLEHRAQFDDTSTLPTPVFFYGMEPGEEIILDEHRGRALVIKYLTVSDPHADGRRNVFFEVNGQPRAETVADRSLTATQTAHQAADPNDPSHVAASMPGMVSNVDISLGDNVGKGQKLLVVEAMKMESTIYSEVAGKVTDIKVRPGIQIETGDLLMIIK